MYGSVKTLVLKTIITNISSEILLYFAMLWNTLLDVYGNR